MLSALKISPNRQFVYTVSLNAFVSLDGLQQKRSGSDLCFFFCHGEKWLSYDNNVLFLTFAINGSICPCQVKE